MEIYLNGYKFRAEILQDNDPPNPRDNDNLAVMALYHKRYNLRDSEAPETCDFQELQELAKESFTFRYVFGYDHGNLVLSTASELSDPFSHYGGFDSGLLGIAYITVDTAHKLKLTPQQAKLLIDAEVETYSAYLSGDVAGFNLYYLPDSFSDNPPEPIVFDSCCGFYGPLNLPECVTEEAMLNAAVMADKSGIMDYIACSVRNASLTLKHSETMRHAAMSLDSVAYDIAYTLQRHTGNTSMRIEYLERILMHCERAKQAFAYVPNPRKSAPKFNIHKAHDAKRAATMAYALSESTKDTALQRSTPGATRRNTENAEAIFGLIMRVMRAAQSELNRAQCDKLNGR